MLPFAMIAIADHPEGSVIAVRAQPGARKTGILGEQAGNLKIAVTAAPERGRANKALREVLCERLKLRRAQVELLSGETSRAKRFLIRGLTRLELENRLNALLQG
jgi:uncharacterized protein (TIGR00251 family)